VCLIQTWTCSISSWRRWERSSPTVAADGPSYRSGSACPFVRPELWASRPAIDLVDRRRPPLALVKTPIGTQPIAAAAHDVDFFMPATPVHQPSSSTAAGGRRTVQLDCCTLYRHAALSRRQACIYCIDRATSYLCPSLHCLLNGSCEPYRTEVSYTDTRDIYKCRPVQYTRSVLFLLHA